MLVLEKKENLPAILQLSPHLQFIFLAKPAAPSTVKEMMVYARDDSQRDFPVQNSVAILLGHCFELSQHCSNIVALKIVFC